ncbi:MAG: hypothetical protein BGO86_00555 [Chryseobacterium sp. 36-9]|nr:MAG: hypothetical protein BGO86_00555 [Chryseobacterium sp. 36-9]
MWMRYFFPVVFVLSFNILYGQILAESGNSAVTIEELIRKSEEAANSNLDSALYYSKKADILIAKMPENIEKVEVYRNLGSIYLAKANFVNASEYTLLATKINDKLYQSDSGNSKLAENKIRLITQLGNISLYQNNFDEAYAIYNKASTLLEKEKAIPAQQVNAIKVKILNNIAAGYSKQRQFRKARGYFETAMKINEKLNDPSLEASLLNNIGICHLEENEFTLAIYYFEQALEIRKKSNDSRGIAQCYNNLGKVYALSDNMEKAGIYFNDALVLGKQIGNIESIIYTLESQTALYEKIKDFQKAFYSQSQLSKLKDSLFNTETVKKVAQVELKYALDKQKEDYEIKRQKTKFGYFAAGGVLLLLLALAGLFLYLQKTKLRNATLSNDKLELERKNLSLEKEKLKEDLEFQNREMASKVMYILKKNELINSVAEQLADIKKTASPQNQKQLQEMIFELRQKKDNEAWKEFETHFTKVHPEFYLKLSQKFSDLTPNEKKLCAFLRLNLSTKEISAITYQSVNSILVSRTRLRKKLDIHGEDVNLTNFLMEL